MFLFFPQTIYSLNTKCHVITLNLFIKQRRKGREVIDSPRRGHSGFDDNALEKPCFTHKGTCPKEPYVLSAEGTKPVVQVGSECLKPFP